jgi:hypothetical protein
VKETMVSGMGVGGRFMELEGVPRPIREKRDSTPTPGHSTGYGMTTVASKREREEDRCELSAVKDRIIRGSLTAGSGVEKTYMVYEAIKDSSQDVTPRDVIGGQEA